MQGRDKDQNVEMNNLNAGINAGILEKCPSRVKSPTSYILQIAAIQMSFSGIGEPMSLRYFLMSEYSAATGSIVSSI
ncbi:hypothetical protein GCM10027275_39900 [Rhabdobacter roseus]|uniref:Uncharacterized protein n=1 Tax=Rhabdobacter roseus TaxID=1655419 RepID=A0A840TVQ0_9BACT|nr:hypothetical protein [Rhabdobacter roseus]MBB5285697.1 hypothetical protein [Rhabdobacter roseus]